MDHIEKGGDTIKAHNASGFGLLLRFLALLFAATVSLPISVDEWVHYQIFEGGPS
jgi:hypothetical protein